MSAPRTDRRRAIEMLDQGKTQADIARAMNIPPGSVYRYDQARKTVDGAPLAMAPGIMARYAAGETPYKIARACRIPRAAVLATLCLRLGDAPVEASLRSGVSPQDLIACGVRTNAIWRAQQSIAPTRLPRLILRSTAPATHSVSISADGTPEARAAAERTMRAILGPNGAWREMAA
jgi:transposase-like protein